MIKLKVGDSVTVKAWQSYASAHYNGQQGTIVKINGDVVVLDIDKAGGGMYAKELTLVKEWD